MYKLKGSFNNHSFEIETHTQSIPTTSNRLITPLPNNQNIEPVCHIIAECYFGNESNPKGIPQMNPGTLWLFNNKETYQFNECWPVFVNFDETIEVTWQFNYSSRNHMP